MSFEKENQQVYKKALKGLVAGVLLGLVVNAGLAGFIYVVDPFYHYHGPWLGMPVILDDAVYQTAGVAENLEYRDAILGTSMTENFHTSWFDEEMGWDTMKLSYSGARTNDLQAILTKMYEHDRQIDHIFMDINDYQYSVPAWTAYADRPEYLYDDKWTNDYNYLFNHDVLGTSMKRVLAALSGAEDNVDSAYTWEAPELFGWKRMLENGVVRRDPADEQTLAEMQTEEYKQESLQMCQDNLDNILPFIQEHPETEFILYFPPYSMLYWDDVQLAGKLEEKLAMYQYVAEQLLVYDNVKLYYFQDEEEIITNIDHYRDVTHHRPEYNRYVFEQIRDDQNRLTADNYKEYFAHMKELVLTCDFDQIWETGSWDWRN